ncbi:hypothetical protein ACFY3G_50350 [Streptomyces phaeochromogenes]
MVFFWCRIGLSTMALLPFGIALLRGWAPQRTRERWSRSTVRRPA